LAGLVLEYDIQTIHVVESGNGRERKHKEIGALDVREFSANVIHDLVDVLHFAALFRRLQQNKSNPSRRTARFGQHIET
jgi:hypothetical protein